MEEKKRQLALNRLKQADESLDEARYLFDGNKSPRAVINRTYYAMFYAILALLIFEEYSSSKHSGVLSYFNSRFVKEGLITRELGRAVNKAFDLRIRGDYREKVSLTKELVEPFLDQAKDFICAVREYLVKTGHLQKP
jgi:uncharacterized protein (UPF0332 family)